MLWATGLLFGGGLYYSWGRGREKAEAASSTNAALGYALGTDHRIALSRLLQTPRCGPLQHIARRPLAGPTAPSSIHCLDNKWERGFVLEDTNTHSTPTHRRVCSPAAQARVYCALTSSRRWLCQLASCPFGMSYHAKVIAAS